MSFREDTFLIDIRRAPEGIPVTTVFYHSGTQIGNPVTVLPDTLSISSDMFNNYGPCSAVVYWGDDPVYHFGPQSVYPGDTYTVKFWDVD